MRTRSLASVCLGIACTIAAAAACGGGGGGGEATNDGDPLPTAGTSGAGNAGTSATAGKSGNSGTGGASGKGGGFQQAPDPVGIVVEPATATISVVDGVAKPLALVAKALLPDGKTGAVVSPSWEIDLGDIASVDKGGSVTATGAKGGLATVKALFNGFAATSAVTVKLAINLNPGKISDPDKAKLAAATDVDAAIPLMYPYDGTVFPRGLAPPRLMWKQAPAAPMMLSLKSGLVELTTTFVPTDGGFDPDPAAWTKLVESGNGGPVEMKLSRLDGGVAKVIAKHTWRLASGSLKGTVYYWANSLGAVVRIKPGATAPDNFLKAAGVTDGCTTCHAVSANGNVLTLGGGKAQAVEDSDASVFDLVGNKVTASKRGRQWAMLALTPDGRFAALNNAPLPGGPGLDGGFYDVATGAKVTGSGFDKELFDMPSFAPDGSKLVYVDHATKGLVSLGYSDMTGKPIAQGKVALVPGGASPIAFPVVSPDGKWAVYHRGPLDTRDGPADLVATGTLTAGAETPLDATNGKTYPFIAGDRDRHLNYEPAFLPIASGGYFWLVFTSRRTYGNQLVGTSAEVKQLWVAAFDQNPQPGKDPSHPAFRLSGQDAATLNMRAYWALDPCKADGAGCGVSSECCGGSCLSADGGMVCGKPPGQMCVPSGGSCKTAADCCGKGYSCINSHCAEPEPE